jgi:hypothetical protein
LKAEIVDLNTGRFSSSFYIVLSSEGRGLASDRSPVRESFHVLNGIIFPEVFLNWKRSQGFVCKKSFATDDDHDVE